MFTVLTSRDSGIKDRGSNPGSAICLIGYVTGLFSSNFPQQTWHDAAYLCQNGCETSTYTNLQLKDRNNVKTGERILCWKLEPASSEKDVVRGVGTDEAVGDASWRQLGRCATYSVLSRNVPQHDAARAPLRNTHTPCSTGYVHSQLMKTSVATNHVITLSLSLSLSLFLS